MADIIRTITDHLRIDNHEFRGQPNQLEGEAWELLNRSGVIDQLKRLPPETQEMVTDGIAALWKIDTIGKAIEAKDEKKIQGVGLDRTLEEANRTLHRKVKEELEEIGRGYHGYKDWLSETVRGLVLTCSETDPQRMGSHKDGIMDFPGRYIRRLSRAPETYLDVAKVVLTSAEREPVDSYLKADGEREKDINEMSKVFNGKLSDIVSRLKPLPQGTK